MTEGLSSVGLSIRRQLEHRKPNSRLARARHSPEGASRDRRSRRGMGSAPAFTNG